jgi:transposase
MAALATRAYLASSGDYYLCPLGEKQFSEQQRRALLQPLWQGSQALQRVSRPAEDGQTPELVAEGFSVDVRLQAHGDGQVVNWTERRWLVRSLAFAQGQHKQRQRRLQDAAEQLERLNQRKQGKKRLSAAQLREAAEGISSTGRVQGLLTAAVRTTRRQRTLRRYGARPEQVVQQQEHRVEVSRHEEAIAQAKREMGWRVYASNQVGLGLAAVVRGYRGQYHIEDGWSRLKGRPLSLTPLYLQEESRLRGLVLLLSLALRLLTLLEWQVRKKLQDSEEKLKGIYPGQPGRHTSRPTAEMLLKAFKGISLTVLELAGQRSTHVTPLSPLQEKLLDLWDLPADLFQRLSFHCAEPLSG